MQLNLEGKTALVTGASRGIGRAIANVLAGEGCHLVLMARSLSDLEITRQQVATANSAVTVRLHPIDLRDGGAIDDAVAQYSDVDILVNNAGAIPHGGLLDVSDDAWLDGWQLKVFGHIRMTRGFYVSMKARRCGVIVNVIGNAGERTVAGYVAGSSGNAALIAFTKAVGSASPADGIRVVGVNPGPTLTERLQKRLELRAAAELGDASQWLSLTSAMPFGRAADPREIADVVAFLASPRAGYVSGTVVTVDGGVANRPPAI